MNDKLIFDRAYGALLGVAIAEAIWANKTRLIESNAPEKGAYLVSFKQALLNANTPSKRLKFECMDFPLTNIMMGVASSIVDTEQNDLDHKTQSLPTGNRVEDKMATMLRCFCNGKSPE